MTHPNAPRLLYGDDPRILLVCDHASNALPPGLDLGVPPEALLDHVAWDIGAEALTRGIAARLGCRAWLASASRLVVDCNREPAHAIPEKSDGLVIPANVGLSPPERQARLALHNAFHEGLARLSGNEAFVSVLKQYETQVAYSLQLPFANPKGIWETADEHLAVIDAIARHDPAAARQAMQTHLLRAAARVGIHFFQP